MQIPLAIDSWLFPDDGATPNNPHLPLVVMSGTGATLDPDPGAWFERRFVANGWSAPWRWTVYPYQHFHSTNHEVLGVFSGTATLLLGGEKGERFEVSTGDVIIIPAGVGHQRLASSGNFQVVGAYPGGREPDLLRPGDGNADAIRLRISEVPLPTLDPVFGKDGPLLECWKA